MEPGSYQWCQVTRGSGHKVKYEGFSGSMRKLFTVQVTEHVHVAQRCGDSLVGDVQKLLGLAPEQPPSGDPA